MTAPSVYSAVTRAMAKLPPMLMWQTFWASTVSDSRRTAGYGPWGSVRTVIGSRVWTLIQKAICVLAAVRGGSRENWASVGAAAATSVETTTLESATTASLSRWRRMTDRACPGAGD